jgi:hypothetical protein
LRRVRDDPKREGHVLMPREPRADGDGTGARGSG